MAKTTFDTNPVQLQTLLKTCEDGKLQLPDFQRSWVWEEERIMSLIASVSRGFPMGALMSLKSKIDTVVVFACRSIEGAPVNKFTKPEQLLLISVVFQLYVLERFLASLVNLYKFYFFWPTPIYLIASTFVLFFCALLRKLGITPKSLCQLQARSEKIISYESSNPRTEP